MQEHLRLGHVGVQRTIEHIRATRPGYNWHALQKQKKEFFCTGCAEGSTQNKPHIGEIPCGSKPGELVYSDLAGPFLDSLNR
jgi:hypothetical protein